MLSPISHYGPGIARSVGILLVAGAIRLDAQTIDKQKCAARDPADSLPVVLGDSAAARAWTGPVLTAISRREVCVGMTVDMMTKSWGLARRLVTTVPGMPGDTIDTYYYRGATVVVVNSTVRALRPPVRRGK